MTDAALVGCVGAAGLLVGVAVPVVSERVPAKARLLEPPYPEMVESLRTLRGWAVALLTGGLFAALADRFKHSWALPAYLVLAAALVVLTLIDLRHFLLPNRIVFPLMAVSIVTLGIAAAIDGDADPFVRAMLGGAAAFGAFLVLHVAAPHGMGFGDVKLAFSLGLFLGWIGWGELGLGLFLGFAYGSLIGIGLIVIGLRSRRDHVPFGPFLAAGTITAILVGNTIIDWYRG